MLVDILDPGFRLGSGSRNQHARDCFYEHQRGCVRREKVWTFSALYEEKVGELQSRKGVAVSKHDDFCTTCCRHLGGPDGAMRIRDASR